MVNMGLIYMLARVGHGLLPYIPRTSNCKKGITSGGGITKRVLASEIESPNFSRTLLQKSASLKQ